MAVGMIQKTPEVDVELPRLPRSFNRVFAPESRAGGLGWPVRLLREPAQLHTDPRAEEDAEHEGQAAHGQKRHSAEAV